MKETETLILSAMDVQWPGHLADLVLHLDELGYHRYWGSEHHGPVQSASPTLMAGLAAGVTDRMRVGTAAVLLKYHSPQKVATDFRLLELFFGDRIDLGVTSAATAEPVHSALLDGRSMPDSEEYARRVEELTALVRREGLSPGGIDGNNIGPQTATVPKVWVCGTSLGSARLAARLGVAYAFHDFLNQWSPKPADGPAVMDTYRNEFQPNKFLPAPELAVAVYGMCAPTEKEAGKLWTNQTPAGFLGTPDQCREQLLDYRERYQTPEIVVQSMTSDFPARLRSYGLLAEAFGLGE